MTVANHLRVSVWDLDDNCTIAHENVLNTDRTRLDYLAYFKAHSCVEKVWMRDKGWRIRGPDANGDKHMAKVVLSAFKSKFFSYCSGKTLRQLCLFLVLLRPCSTREILLHLSLPISGTYKHLGFWGCFFVWKSPLCGYRTSLLFLLRARRMRTRVWCSKQRRNDGNGNSLRDGYETVR